MELINRPKYSLSAENPVRLSLNCHKEKITARFDMHFEMELGIVVSGRMKRFYQNREVTLNQGDVWACGMWEPHGFSILKLPCKVIVFTVYPQLILGTHFEELKDFKPASFFASPSDKKLRLKKEERIRTLELAKRLERAHNCKGGERAALLRVCLYELLLLMYAAGSARKQNFDAADSGSITLVTGAIQLVLDSKKLVTEEKAAEKCGLGKNRFNALFKSATGMSFYKFGLKYRLSNVAGRLRRTNDPLKAIAADWGFFDASHLHRLFVQNYGCSPGGYKKLHSRQVLRVPALPD